MARYKRRIVYLSDHLWESLAELAGMNGDSVSRTIRDLVTDGLNSQLPGFDADPDSPPDLDGPLDDEA